MPRLPIEPEAARDIAAFLLLWSKPARDVPVQPPTPEEVAVVTKRLKTYGRDQLGSALVREKRCAACHPGLGQPSADARGSRRPLEATQNVRPRPARIGARTRKTLRRVPSGLRPTVRRRTHSRRKTWLRRRKDVAAFPARRIFKRSNRFVSLCRRIREAPVAVRGA